mmetsp:Transcript_88190/g.257786  ORF Transcript_88190/g.257786 Transcript_88190/m.257786 type:complete len:357 (-) Transcript_88190:1777-2847(-)
MNPLFRDAQLESELHNLVVGIARQYTEVTTSPVAHPITARDVNADLPCGPVRRRAIQQLLRAHHLCPHMALHLLHLGFCRRRTATKADIQHWLNYVWGHWARFQLIANRGQELPEVCRLVLAVVRQDRGHEAGGPCRPKHLLHLLAKFTKSWVDGAAKCHHRILDWLLRLLVNQCGQHGIWEAPAVQRSFTVVEGRHEAQDVGVPLCCLLVERVQVLDPRSIGQAELPGHGLRVLLRRAGGAGIENQHLAWVVLLLGATACRAGVLLGCRRDLLHHPLVAVVVVLRPEVEVPHLVVPDRAMHASKAANPTPLCRHLAPAPFLPVHVGQELRGDCVVVHDAELLLLEGMRDCGADRL